MSEGRPEDDELRSSFVPTWMNGLLREVPDRASAAAATHVPAWPRDDPLAIVGTDQDAPVELTRPVHT